MNKVHSHPNPQWLLSYVVFVIGTIEDCIQGVRNKGLDEGGGGEQMSVVMQLKVLPSCQLSVVS